MKFDTLGEYREWLAANPPAPLGDCARCGAGRQLGRPDPCLGMLRNVAHACCGHGNPDFAYVVIAEGCEPSTDLFDLDSCLTLRREKALNYFRDEGCSV